jgi:hypothetical protein
MYEGSGPLKYLCTALYKNLLSLLYYRTVIEISASKRLKVKFNRKVNSLYCHFIFTPWRVTLHCITVVATFRHCYFFYYVATAPSGPGPPHCRGFTITLRCTTLGWTLLTELSARRRDLHLTTHNTHKRQTSRYPARFEPTVPASERSQTHALDRAATGIGSLLLAFSYMNPVRSLISYTI